MKNIDYCGKNDKILEEWQDAYLGNGGKEELFANDGIMFRGKSVTYKDGGGRNCWMLTESEDGKENRL